MKKINKRVLILLITAVTIAVLFFIAYTTKKPLSQRENHTSQIPLIPIQQETMDIQGVKIKNFLTSNKLTTPNGDIVIENKPQQYEISYTPTNNNFTIHITGSFTQLKSTAENDLLTTLGVNAAETCKLSIHITTSDAAYTNDRYLLTACSPAGEGVR